MPSPGPVLNAEEAGRIVAERGFAPRPPSSQRLVGIEIEWLPVRLDAPDQAADPEVVRDVAGRLRLPRGSRVSFEPGGQVELSTVAAPGLDAIGALAADGICLGEALAEVGVGLTGIGLEPGRRRGRGVHSPRYDAMEAYFDASGVAGRTMMRSTAAVQVNVDLGPPGHAEARWDLAHALGPVLAAAFANSPFLDGRPSRWCSTRLAVWHAIDRTRTAPVANGTDCRHAWAEYALAADVMLVRRADDDHVAVRPGFAFAEWIRNGHPMGWPTVDDLEYHLTTLFPPVRPRGWLELRMVDALPQPWWRVPVVVWATLLNDPDAAAAAAEAAAASRDLWLEAARHGLAHPVLARSARGCFDAALDALARTGADAPTTDVTLEFVDRYVRRGRSPADDLVDRWRRDGTVQPPLDNARPTDARLGHA